MVSFRMDINNNEKIVEFFQQHGLQKWLPKFIEEEVDYSTLLTYSESDLLELGMVKKGPRDKLLNLLQAVKTSNFDHAELLGTKSSLGSESDSTLIRKSKDLSSEPDDLYIFVDNSNLWIEGQRILAQMNKLQRSDCRARINVRKLLELIKNNYSTVKINKPRNIVKTCVYGSEKNPETVYDLGNQQVTAVWKHDSREVITHKRCRRTDKEKAVDTQMAIDVIQTVMTLSRDKCPKEKVLVLVCGDGDYWPCVSKALELNWRVELLFWSHSTNQVFMSETNPLFKRCSLTEFFSQVVYTNWKWKGTIPVETSIILHDIAPETREVHIEEEFRKAFEIMNMQADDNGIALPWNKPSQPPSPPSFTPMMTKSYPPRRLGTLLKESGDTRRNLGSSFGYDCSLELNGNGLPHFQKWLSNGDMVAVFPRFNSNDLDQLVDCLRATGVQLMKNCETYQNFLNRTAKLSDEEETIPTSTVSSSSGSEEEDVHFDYFIDGLEQGDSMLCIVSGLRIPVPFSSSQTETTNCSNWQTVGKTRKCIE